MKTWLRVFVIILILFWSGAGFSEVTKLAPEHRKLLQKSDQFKTIRLVKELPKSIIALCADGNGRIANPGEQWEPTDVILSEFLPRKRLIWASYFQNYYLMYYESGGIAHSYHVLLAQLEEKGSNAKILWHGVGEPLSDYKAFLTAVEQNKLDDRLPYSR